MPDNRFGTLSRNINFLSRVRVPISHFSLSGQPIRRISWLLPFAIASQPASQPELWYNNRRQSVVRHRIVRTLFTEETLNRARYLGVVRISLNSKHVCSVGCCVLKNFDLVWTVEAENKISAARFSVLVD